MVIYARMLAGGDIAIGIFNLSENPGAGRFNLDELGLPNSTGRTLEMTEVWTGEKLLVTNSTISRNLAPFDCEVFRARLVRQ